MSPAKPPQPYRGTPFRYVLRNEFPGRAGKLMRLAKDGRVVRMLKGWSERDIAALARFVSAFERDGLGVPRYDVVRAPRWDRPEAQATYIVTESIAGEPLDQIAAPSRLDWALKVPRAFYARFYEDLDAVMTHLIAHYERMLTCGGLIFRAMDQSQFVYGTTRADRTPRVYFVDLDPTYLALPPGAPAAAVQALKAEFGRPVDMLFEMQLLHPEAQFPRAEDAARRYFAVCAGTFPNFYAAGSPWWAQSPHFAAYQRMKSRLATAPRDEMLTRTLGGE